MLFAMITFYFPPMAAVDIRFDWQEVHSAEIPENTEERSSVFDPRFKVDEQVRAPS
jgi:hypothetical protein